MTTDLPRLFYVCDFPPANRGGGDTLLLRLLEGYPLESLFIAASHRRIDALAGGPLRACKQLGLYEFTGKKRHGMAQFLLLLDRLLIPLHALRLAWHARKWKAQVVLTVAHGYLFLAAHLCAALCKLPIVMIVHDDWIAMERYVRIFRLFLKPLFRWSLRRSAHLYAVSEAMVEYLKETYGVSAALQLPATFPSEPSSLLQTHYESATATNRPIRIVYAGMIYGTVFQSLDFLARHLQRRVHRAGETAPPVELHIYSPLTQDEPNSASERLAGPATASEGIGSGRHSFPAGELSQFSRLLCRNFLPLQARRLLGSRPAATGIGPRNGLCGALFAPL